MGQNRDNEQLQAVSAFIDQGLIDEVLGVVKSGKEATVYCCATSSRSAPLLAAKVYRSRNVRRFSNDAVYTAGRQRQGHRREARAMENRSRFGREAAFEKWVADEYETLSILHRAGADVPEPIAMSGPVIMMEYIGDAGEPAPPLSSVTLDRDEADGLFRRLLHNIELALASDRVHGDLSAFNVLYRPGAPCIIDFPQAVDPRFNPNALALLGRDIENLHGYSGAMASAPTPHASPATSGGGSCGRSCRRASATPPDLAGWSSKTRRGEKASAALHCCSMVSHETMRRVLQEHVDAENAHDRGRVLATYVPEGPEFDDVPTGRRFTGGDEIIGNYRNLWDGFPGLVRRIDRWTFGDDGCVIELTLSGTHDGPYRGIPATGRKLELRIAAHFAFDERGLIKRETAYYDSLTFMRQLGLTK